jgi:hypothetical protein
MSRRPKYSASSTPAANSRAGRPTAPPAVLPHAAQPGVSEAENGADRSLTLIPKKPDSELSVLARQMAEGRADSANMLNEKEILHAATLTPDLEERAASTWLP